MKLTENCKSNTFSNLACTTLHVTVFINTYCEQIKPFSRTPDLFESLLTPSVTNCKPIEIHCH